MRVEMLQPFKTKRVICPAVLRNRKLLITRYIRLLVPRRDVNASFVDDKRRGCVPSGADALDNGNPLSIARLNELRSSTSLRTSDNFHRPNHAHLEACLVEVVHIVVIN